MRTVNPASYKLIERPIYGSSRVGIDNTPLELIGYTAPTSGILTHVLGLKQYEFTNHLGNVLTTVTDKKIPVDVGNDGTIDYYVADITSATDYYPFGSPMDGRAFSGEKYRFGFNGKENDDELKGDGNSLDFGARIYDSRLGRWLSLDPLMTKYASLTPYNFCANNPVIFIDPDGKKIVDSKKREVFVTIQKADDGIIVATYKYANGTIVNDPYFLSNGKVIIDQMVQTETGNDQVNFAMQQTFDVRLHLDKMHVAGDVDDFGHKVTPKNGGLCTRTLSTDGVMDEEKGVDIIVYQKMAESVFLPGEIAKGNDLNLNNIIGAIANHEFEHMKKENIFLSFFNKRYEIFDKNDPITSSQIVMVNDLPNVSYIFQPEQRVQDLSS